MQLHSSIKKIHNIVIIRRGNGIKSMNCKQMTEHTLAIKQVKQMMSEYYLVNNVFVSFANDVDDDDNVYNSNFFPSISFCFVSFIFFALCV